MAEEIEEETKIEKGIKAKGASLWGQIIAAIWIAGFCAAMFITAIIRKEPVKITDIILSGFAIAACFVPVYFNLIMDKIKEIKLGGE